MRAVSVLVWLAALAAAAPAAGVVANLDADPRRERVEIADASPGSALGQRIVLRDRCGGLPVHVRLSGVYDTVDYLRVQGVDGFAERPEIVFELRTGGGGHVGVTTIVRYGERGQPGCVDPIKLFRYRPDAPPLEPPKRHGPANWTVKIRN